MRKLVAVFVIVGVLLVGYGIVAGQHRHAAKVAALAPDSGDSPAGPVTSAAVSTSSSSTSTSTTVDPNFSVDAPSSPWRAISDNATSKADYFAQLNDPTRSDLPVEDARALDALGAKLARADTTGEGRGAFPGYWGDASNDQGPCCRNLVIHASSATRYGGGPDVAQVAVIWSADRPGAQPVSEETTVYYFARQAGGWKPLHGWELPQ